MDIDFNSSYNCFSILCSSASSLKILLQPYGVNDQGYKEEEKRDSLGASPLLLFLLSPKSSTDDDKDDDDDENLDWDVEANGGCGWCCIHLLHPIVVVVVVVVAKR